MLLASKPDLLLIDMSLSGVDSLSVLQTAHSSGVRPIVVAIISVPSGYTIGMLDDLQIVYLLRKPCEIEITAARLIDIARYPHKKVSFEPDNMERLGGLIQALGFQSEQRQYPVLLETLVCYAANPEQSITKSLYPAVAKKLGGHGTRIEKAVRDIIKNVWQTRDDHVWRFFFPANVNKVPPQPPTNRQFILRLTQILLDMTEKTSK